MNALETIKWLTSLVVDLDDCLDDDYRYHRFTPVESTKATIVDRVTYATWEMRLLNGFVVYFNNESLVGESSRGGLKWSLRMVDESMAALGYTHIVGEYIFSKNLPESSLKEVIINFLKVHIRDGATIIGDNLPIALTPTVRPLEWQPMGNSAMRAATGLYTYYVHKYRNYSNKDAIEYYYVFSLGQRGLEEEMAHCGTIEEAHDAAQEHYSQLILGCLI